MQYILFHGFILLFIRNYKLFNLYRSLGTTAESCAIAFPRYPPVVCGLFRENQANKVRDSSGTAPRISIYNTHPLCPFVNTNEDFRR
jgi:hypothetical protein